MSLCWKIYHFFSPYILKKLKLTTPDAPTCDQNRYSEKKNLCKKVPFLTTAGLWKNGNFSHMIPPEKIIFISSRFAIEPWDPWNTLPNSRRSDSKQKIQNLKKFEF